MDFAQQQRNPAKHLAGLTFVALLHIFIIWALVNGLATKVIDVLKKPIETKIIEEVKPPPPPEPKLPPPPKLLAPPPPYIPPPEVQIQQPQIAPTITTQSNQAPAKQDFTKEVATPTAAPARRNVAGSCSNVKEVAGSITYPIKATRQGVTSGRVDVELASAGGVITIEHVSSTNRLFDSVATDAVKQLKCQDGRFQWQIDFKLED